MKDPAAVKKDVFVLCGLLVVVGVVCFVLFVVMPAFKNFTSFAAEDQKLRQQIAAAEQLLASRDELNAEIEQLRQNIRRYEALLPKSIEVAAVLNYIIEQGKQFSIAFVALEPLPSSVAAVTQQQTTYLEFPVKVKVKAGYHDLARFFNSLETASRFMEVRDYSLLANPRAAGPHEVSATIVAFSLQEAVNVQQ